MTKNTHNLRENACQSQLKAKSFQHFAVIRMSPISILYMWLLLQLICKERNNIHNTRMDFGARSVSILHIKKAPCQGDCSLKPSIH